MLASKLSCLKGFVKAFFELILFSTITIALVLILPQVLLATLHICPMALSFYIILWVTGLSLDVYSTWRFYKDDPGRFHLREASLVLKRFYRSLGFWRGVAATILLMDGLAVLLLSIVCIPVAARVTGVDVGCWSWNVASAMALAGLIHLLGATYNLSVEALNAIRCRRGYKKRF